MTTLQKIEEEIMCLEIDYKSWESDAYKKKWNKRITELRERRKTIMHNMKYNFKK